MIERTQAFEPDPRIDGQYPAADFHGEMTLTEPGNEPGFFETKYDLDASLAPYVRSLDEVPKFSIPEEIELAKKIEAGKFAEQLLATCDPKKSHEERENATERLRELYLTGQLPLSTAKNAAEMTEANRKVAFEAMLYGFVGTPNETHKRQDLAKTVRAGETANDQLIHSVLRLVVKIVTEDYWGDLPLSRVDMVQCGNLGVVRAIGAYDYSKGVSFGQTFVSQWIHKEIRAGLLEARRQKYLRGTTEEQIRADQVHKAMLQLESDPAAPAPTVSALAKVTGIKEDWVWDVLDSSNNPTSVEALLEDFGDGIVDKKAPEIDETVFRRTVPEQALDQLRIEQAEGDVELLLGILSPGERSVMRKMCGYEGNYEKLADIAHDLGVKPSTVDTQYRRALKKLRSRSPEFLGRLADRLGVRLIIPEENDSEPTE